LPKPVQIYNPMLSTDNKKETDILSSINSTSYDKYSLMGSDCMLIEAFPSIWLIPLA